MSIEPSLPVAAPLRPWTMLRYDTQAFPFADLLRRDVFKVARLDLLHEYVKAQRQAHGLKPQLSHQDNLALRKLIQDLPDDAPFFRLYHHFVRKTLLPLIGRALSYSSHPKLRVHLPGTSSVSTFHHDIIVTKRVDQVNFWMPFTDVQDTATLWLESDYGRGDYAPIAVPYGTVLIFDGGYLSHGSVPNTTAVTRISLDMRFSFKRAQTRAEGIELMNHLIKCLEDVGEANAQIPAK